jgi:hypothetical protein
VQPVPVWLEAASIFTFWVSLAFPLVTALFWPWWQSDWGRNIVLFDACICVSLLPAPLHAMFGVPYGTFLAWFQVAAVFGTGGVLAWRAVMIWRTQRAGGDQ